MTFRPVTTSNSLGQNFNELNNVTRQLNKEQQIKVFKGPNNTNAVIIGKYGESGYGLLIADSTGTNRILIGQAPNDGRPGVWVSKDGEDVLTLLA